jgi:hypothetical protein
MNIPYYAFFRSGRLWLAGVSVVVQSWAIAGADEEKTLICGGAEVRNVHATSVRPDVAAALPTDLIVQPTKTQHNGSNGGHQMTIIAFGPPIALGASSSEKIRPVLTCEGSEIKLTAYIEIHAGSSNFGVTTPRDAIEIQLVMHQPEVTFETKWLWDELSVGGAALANRDHPWPEIKKRIKAKSFQNPR